VLFGPPTNDTLSRRRNCGRALAKQTLRTDGCGMVALRGSSLSLEPSTYGRTSTFAGVEEVPAQPATRQR